MVSSSSSTTSGNIHQEGYTVPKLARQNSSFLGTIKNIVTAPLSWFGHPDDGDAMGGKRRRSGTGTRSSPVFGLHGATLVTMTGEKDGGNSSADELDEASRRPKRMRLHSPSRTVKTTTSSNSTIRRTSVVPRASSAVLPSSRGLSRATLAPRRQSHKSTSIQRTMSTDPPQFANVDIDMIAIDSFGDIAMPPSPRHLSPRPSFRMRSSITPQPTQQHFLQRHISEPPPLNVLLANPVFVHAPQEQETKPAPAPTLGSLTATARTARSPVKQHHSSLLFKHDKQESHKDAPAERALQQLDVYKTPLLPTRLRAGSDSITATVVPDMFRSRRSSRLVLMSDDRERSGAKKNKGLVVNETKPYAGEGGMKKLLARAKLEAERENEKENESGMARPMGEDPVLLQPSLPPSAPPSSNWFKGAVADTPAPSGSSLRVGRQKTSRNHIQRPSKSRFSAVYEDEGDGAMGDNDKTKERQALEEAAKKVPVFNISAGFSFAKETPAPVPSVTDLDKAKEPPIKSLPFSFKSSPVSTPEPAKLVPEWNHSQSAAAAMSSLGTAFGAVRPRHTKEPVQKTAPSQSSFCSAPKGSVPNFFSNSQVLRASTIPTAPPALSFGVAASESSTMGLAGSSSTIPFGTPLGSTRATNDTSPFWDPTKDKAEEIASLLGIPGPISSIVPPSPKTDASAEVVSALPIASESLFSFARSGEAKAVVTTSVFTERVSSEEGKPTSPAPFSLGKLEEKAATSSSPLFFGQPVPTANPVSSAGSFGMPAETREKAEETAHEAPKPLFRPPIGFNNLLGEVSKSTTTCLFGEKGVDLLSTVPPPQSTPSPLPFPPAPGEASKTGSFRSGPSTTVTLAAAEVTPKPPFHNSVFAFEQEKKAEIKSSLFTFGPTSGTPPTGSEAKPSNAVFTFGQSAASTPVPTSTTPVAPPPISFSFSGGGSAGTDVTNKPPFIFAVPPNSATQAERLVTPPKSHDLDLRMEESPVRDMQINGNVKAPEARSSFSFGSAGLNSTSLFGTQGDATASSTISSTAAFTFGTPSARANPFVPKKPTETKPFGVFGTPQTTPISTSFSFGQQAEENRPSSAGALVAFGQTPTSATNPMPFSFGATNAASNLFGTGSAPASPLTFAQSSSFNFAATSATSSPFAFGSQPSSPSATTNATLPPPATGFGQTPSPSSPFAAPLPLAASTSSGGALFTIGAAPPPPTGRQIKKLPRRPVKR